MKKLRWIASFPVALIASMFAWALAIEVVGGSSAYGGGLLYSILGLLPLIITAAIPTVVFVLTGVLVGPSKERRVCFAFFGLSLLFSAGGIHVIQNQDDIVFWSASAGGIISGAAVGLAVALRLPRFKRPIQPAQTSRL